MKWIKASERLPNIEQKVIWKFTYGLYEKKQASVYTRLTIDNSLWLYDEDSIPTPITEIRNLEWLDETPEDWEALEKKFNEDFSTLTDKPMVGYDIIQWFKEKLDGK
jgi:hypothetical protein